MRLRKAGRRRLARADDGHAKAVTILSPCAFDEHDGRFVENVAKVQRVSWVKDGAYVAPARSPFRDSLERATLVLGIKFRREERFLRDAIFDSDGRFRRLDFRR